MLRHKTGEITSARSLVLLQVPLPRFTQLGEEVDVCILQGLHALVLRERGLPPGIGVTHRFTHFQHLFYGSGYAAGYYVYLWAEVLDADAVDAFEEAGSPFDGQVAQRLLRHIYAAGDSVEPGTTYRAFRGRDARIEAMLQKKGLLEPAA